MAAHRFVLCDVFAQRPLEGNALCVFTDARNLDDDRMQRLARETNLSETSFVLPPRDGGDVPGAASSPRHVSCPSPGTR